MLEKIKTVGYRYGKAPESGLSYNYAENRNEDGLSMASVAHTAECRSFATMEAKESRRKYFYEGEICGTGGDDEFLLTNIKQITGKEYRALKNKETTGYIINEKLEEAKGIRDRHISRIEAAAGCGEPNPNLIADAEKYYNKMVGYWSK